LQVSTAFVQVGLNEIEGTHGIQRQRRATRDEKLIVQEVPHTHFSACFDAR